MHTSPNFSAVAKAFVEASADLDEQPLVKDAKNTEFGSSYVTLAQVLAIVRPIATRHGLAIMQGVVPSWGGEPESEAASDMLEVETRLIHTSGEWIANVVRMPLSGRRVKGGGIGPLDPQAGGSALSYGRRYGLLAIFSIAAEDDDGRAARPRPEREAAPVSQATAQPLIPGIMPIGKTWKGKPIKDVPLPALRAALAHCRSNSMKGEMKIIAAELNERALAGNTVAETTLREASMADDTVALALDEARK